MAELCKFSGQILYRIDGNTVKDFYGRPLYIIDGDKLLKWDSRAILYRFDGYTIKDFYGRSLYSFDGVLIPLHSGPRSLGHLIFGPLNY